MFNIFIPVLLGSGWRVGPGSDLLPWCGPSLTVQAWLKLDPTGAGSTALSAGQLYASRQGCFAALVQLLASDDTTTAELATEVRPPSESSKRGRSMVESNPTVAPLPNPDPKARTRSSVRLNGLVAVVSGPDRPRGGGHVSDRDSLRARPFGRARSDGRPPSEP
eukprot:17923-Prorocentrum_minimum.AAC.1